MFTTIVASMVELANAAASLRIYLDVIRCCTSHHFFVWDKLLAQVHHIGLVWGTDKLSVLSGESSRGVETISLELPMERCDVKIISSWEPLGGVCCDGQFLFVLDPFLNVMRYVHSQRMSAEVRLMI